MHFTAFGKTPLLLALVMPFTSAPAWAGDATASWKQAEAGHYLDERANAWFAFPSAGRGEAEMKTACVSCHTAFPYALARPVLRKLTGVDQPTAYEQQLLEYTKRRVEHWEELDSPKLQI